jgi:hypothetical protein
LDSPDLSAMLTGTSQQSQAQQRGVPTPPPSVPVAVAPIPTQTFTNQNFVSVSTANVTQQVCFVVAYTCTAVKTLMFRAQEHTLCFDKVRKRNVHTD